MTVPGAALFPQGSHLHRSALRAASVSFRMGVGFAEELRGIGMMHLRKGRVISASEKAKAKAEQAAGKAKKEAGRAVGNESAAAEGSAKESKGDLRGAREKAKDAFKD
ncbi:hypothetical protein San01_17180 [Streptomyces angustmyceticus]|uniref:CsbD-like domain-containing protein n=2 Tax=Streptomyces angustmyceticus TaxID=285578 RepID=A0A5J4LBK2_9ACTN|nr:hypothetical protein San01_17180 [Streptomyces angustmyceticus]